MNILLLYESEFRGKAFAEVVGERARYLIEQHAVGKGLKLRAGILGGSQGVALIQSVSPEQVVIEYQETSPGLTKRPLVAIVGASRPRTMRRVIWAACELGLRELHIVRSANSEKSYLDSKLLKDSGLRTEVLRGLEQAGDTVPPLIAVHPRFRTFVEDKLPAIRSSLGDPLLLVGDTHATQESLNQFSGPTVSRGAVVVIGPERGWNESELEFLEQRGAKRVGLGARMLRVDTALVFVVGKLAEA